MISQGELGLGEGPRSHEAPFMGGGCMEQGDGRDQDDCQGDAQKPPADQLAPHVDVVGQGLAAPERGVAEHDGSFLVPKADGGSYTAPLPRAGKRPGRAAARARDAWAKEAR